MVDVNNFRAQTMQNILNAAVSVRAHEITNAVFDAVKGVVQAGPFRGMRLLSQSSWCAVELCPRLLGCYEAELHGVVEEAMAKAFPLVINVGCAEGFYAVGLARRMRNSRVVAYDVSEAAHKICRAAAEINGVSERLTLKGACTPEELAKDLEGGDKAFLLVDCEGAEVNILDPDRAPALARCDILVECHDFVNRNLTNTLMKRFAPTHDIERIEEGPRDPNHPLLHRVNSLDRWLAVCEFRNEHMHWLMLRAKAAH